MRPPQASNNAIHYVSQLIFPERQTINVCVEIATAGVRENEDDVIILIMGVSDWCNVRICQFRDEFKFAPNLVAGLEHELLAGLGMRGNPYLA
jgi:hypothetical protein